MTPAEVLARLEEKVGGGALELHADPKKDKDPWFEVAASALVPVAMVLRDDEALACDYLECLTGTDYPPAKQIRLTYHLYSYARKHRVVFKVLLDREEPRAPTLGFVWPVAFWQERECFDLLGVVFEGHPDLRRILLPDDWVGHPLRKDWVEQSAYRGIPTSRPNPIDLFKITVPAKPAKAAASAPKAAEGAPATPDAGPSEAS